MSTVKRTLTGTVALALVGGTAVATASSMELEAAPAAPVPVVSEDSSTTVLPPPDKVVGTDGAAIVDPVLYHDPTPGMVGRNRGYWGWPTGAIWAYRSPTPVLKCRQQMNRCR